MSNIIDTGNIIQDIVDKIDEFLVEELNEADKAKSNGLLTVDVNALKGLLGTIKDELKPMQDMNSQEIKSLQEENKELQQRVMALETLLTNNQQQQQQQQQHQTPFTNDGSGSNNSNTAAVARAAAAAIAVSSLRSAGRETITSGNISNTNDTDDDDDINNNTNNNNNNNNNNKNNKNNNDNNSSNNNNSNHNNNSNTSSHTNITGKKRSRNGKAIDDKLDVSGKSEADSNGSTNTTTSEDADGLSETLQAVSNTSSALPNIASAQLNVANNGTPGVDGDNSLKQSNYVPVSNFKPENLTKRRKKWAQDKIADIETFQLMITEAPESVAKLYNEFETSVKFQIQQFELQYGKGKLSKIPKIRTYQRRAALVREIQSYASANNCSVDESIAFFDKLVTDNKKTVAWLYNNLAKVLNDNMI